MPLPKNHAVYYQKSKNRVLIFVMLSVLGIFRHYRQELLNLNPAFVDILPIMQYTMFIGKQKESICHELYFCV